MPSSRCETARSIYEVPLLLERAGLGKLITRELDIPASEPDLADWQELVARIRAPRPDLEIAIVGKYTELPDAYISVTEALKHAALHHASTSRCAGSARSSWSAWSRSRWPAS